MSMAVPGATLRIWVTDGPVQESDVLILRLMSWNDWFIYRTLYYCYYKDAEGEMQEVGPVKVALDGHVYSNSSEHATPLPSLIDEPLGAPYFSLGQDESYYTNMRKLLGGVRAHAAFVALRDLALTPDRIDELSDRAVLGSSLLRSVPTVTARKTFPGLARGHGHTAYQFVFNRPSENPLVAAAVMDFAVAPTSTPPTNVHVLIGRNGSGKTRTLRHMALAMLGSEAGDTDSSFRDLDDQPVDFASLVYVAFSAFDDAVLPVIDEPDRYDVRYSYVGLRAPRADILQAEGFEARPEDLAWPRQTQPPESLAGSFAESAWAVMREKSREAWRTALRSLESDNLFRDHNIAQLADIADDMTRDAFMSRAAELYGVLSSGHKIVLLTVTRLVQTVSDRSMVLLDEPEGHLHPPLLSAFIRTLSNLMTDRNGIAIVATHSPVILQEVPRSCAFQITRTEETFRADRLDTETFGENIGVLTTSVFGLEVADSGFHKMLIDKAVDLRDYDAVVREFGRELGSDARALLRAWFTDERIPITSYQARRVFWRDQPGEDAPDA
jgi:predicted ATPase